MSIAYRTKVNKRPVGGEQFISSEQHTIGISGAFLSTPSRIRLVEVPLQETISSVSIPGYTEVPYNGPAPTGFQFAVDYSIGRVYFDPARNGNTVFVSYKGRGSEVDSEDVNELDIPVGAALNSDGTLSNGIVHPNAISTVATDDFVFPRDVTATRNLIVDNNATVTGAISQGGTTLTINTAETGSPTLNAQFVVNRGSSTPVSLRWNESLQAWEFVNNVTATFQFFNSGAFSLTGPIRLGDGTAGAPSYSFSSATNLGIFKSATDTLGFATAGVEQWRIGGGGDLQSQNNGTLRSGDGSLSGPGLSFAADTDTGIFRVSSNDMALVTGGIKAIEIDSAQRAIFSSTGGSGLRIYGDAGTHQWDMYLNSTNIRFSDNTGGGKVQIDTDLSVSGKIYNSDGSDLLPSYTFLSDTGTGISTIANNLLFSVSTVAGGEVARFTAAGDFQIKEGEKIIMDGIGNAFLRFTSAASMYGQTSNLGGFHFGSNNELVLFANSVVGEPTLSMLTDGTVVVKNSTQGTDLNRTLKLEISQQFASGYHRTFQLFPSDANLGTAATGTATVVNFAALSGAVLTVNGVTLTEGVQWTASGSNNTTAASLATAIVISGVATGSALTNVVTITANTPGVAGNSITLTTSDPTNLPVSGATLSGGADDFVVAMGYKANGTTVSAGTIDTHGSLPLIVTVNDTEMMQVTTTAIDAKSHNIQNVADPVADTDAANKRYVNNVAAGLDPKGSCLAGTTGSNLSVTASGSGVGKTLTATANGVLTLDGISTWVDITNDGGVNDPFSTSTKASRVLVKDQTTASNNGIYAVQQKGDGSHPYILVRATDFDGSPSNEVSGGNFTFIEQGTNLAGTGWVVVASGSITVDTGAINWTQFSSGAIPIVSSDPGAPTLGRVWFNSTDSQFKGYNGTSVVLLG